MSISQQVPVCIPRPADLVQRTTQASIPIKAHLQLTVSFGFCFHHPSWHLLLHLPPQLWSRCYLHPSLSTCLSPLSLFLSTHPSFLSSLLHSLDHHVHQLWKKTAKADGIQTTKHVKINWLRMNDSEHSSCQCWDRRRVVKLKSAKTKHIWKPSITHMLRSFLLFDPWKVHPFRRYRETPFSAHSRLKTQAHNSAAIS